MNFIAFNIILDDIVFPDGRTAMGVLGGGGPQAAFGMKLWAEAVGLVAGVGRDLPEAAKAWLDESGIDTAGLRVSGLPTPRAWQVMEADGRRTQVWRVPGPVIGAQLGHSLDHLPESYRPARGFHFGLHPDEPPLDFIAGLRASGGLVSIEPFKPADHRPTQEALRALLTAGQVFSPNLLEARSLLGPGEPHELARRLVASRAQIVALRMGTEGTLVAEGQSRRGAYIPAVPVTVVDTVGAGNAYCGGFLVGWAQTHDLVTAGLYGAVAASFLVEQVGVPAVTPAVRAEGRRRLEALRSQVETYDMEITNQ
jgi:sugar/nucleoside kinase (ribokinase family)